MVHGPAAVSSMLSQRLIFPPLIGDSDDILLNMLLFIYFLLNILKNHIQMP